SGPIRGPTFARAASTVSVAGPFHRNGVSRRTGDADAEAGQRGRQRARLRDSPDGALVCPLLAEIERTAVPATRDEGRKCRPGAPPFVPPRVEGKCLSPSWLLVERRSAGVRFGEASHILLWLVDGSGRTLPAPSPCPLELGTGS